MAKVIYGIRTPAIGFDNSSIDKLNKVFEDKGYKFQQPQLGGGPNPEIIVQTIAWLNVNSFLASVFLIAAEHIVIKLYKEVRKWYIKNPPKKVKNTKVKNVVEINISSKLRSFNITLDISREYSKNEVTAIICGSKHQGDNTEVKND